MTIEEVVKKTLADLFRNATPGVTSGLLPPRTYVSVVAPEMTKTKVRIRIDGAQNPLSWELLSNSKQHIQDTNVIRQMRSNDTEVFVQSAF